MLPVPLIMNIQIIRFSTNCNIVIWSGILSRRFNVVSSITEPQLVGLPCRMALNDDPEKHRVRSRTLHTDRKCVIVKSLIREDQSVKIREMHCKKRCFNTSHRLERNAAMKEYLNF
jgi:hypothetical protein